MYYRYIGWRVFWFTCASSCFCLVACFTLPRLLACFSACLRSCLPARLARPFAPVQFEQSSKRRKDITGFRPVFAL